MNTIYKTKTGEKTLLELYNRQVESLGIRYKDDIHHYQAPPLLLAGEMVSCFQVKK